MVLHTLHELSIYAFLQTVRHLLVAANQSRQDKFALVLSLAEASADIFEKGCLEALMALAFGVAEQYGDQGFGGKDNFLLQQRQPLFVDDLSL